MKKRLDGEILFRALAEHPRRRNVMVAAKELTTERLIDSKLDGRMRMALPAGGVVSISEFLKSELYGEALVIKPSRRESIENGFRECGIDPEVGLPADIVVRLLQEYRSELRRVVKL